MIIKLYIRHILFFAIIIFGAFKVNAQNFDVRISIIDVESVLENSLVMQEIKKKVDEIRKVIEENVSQKEIAFKKIEEDLIQKKNTLNEKELDEQIDNFNKQVSAAQQDMQSKKVRLEQAHNNAVEKVHEAIFDIIKDLADKYHCNLILPSSQVLYVASELDITQEVLEALNNKITTIEVKY